MGTSEASVDAVSILLRAEMPSERKHPSSTWSARRSPRVMKLRTTSTACEMIDSTITTSATNRPRGRPACGGDEPPREMDGAVCEFVTTSMFVRNAIMNETKALIQSDDDEFRMGHERSTLTIRS